MFGCFFLFIHVTGPMFNVFIKYVSFPLYLCYLFILMDILNVFKLISLN